MEINQTKLTESTIAIQQENALVIKEIRDKMPLLCMARNYPCLMQHHSTDGKNADGSGQDAGKPK
jgi:hypothetical protein